MKRAIKYTLISAIILIADICIAQKKASIDLSNSINLIDNKKYAYAINTIVKIDTTGASLEDRALWLYYLGYAYNLEDRQDLAYLNMKQSKSFYQNLKKESDVKDCNIQLLSILRHQNELKNQEEAQDILEELKKYVDSKKDEDHLVQFAIFREIGSGLIDVEEYEEALKVFNQSYRLSTKINDTIQSAFDLVNIGVTHYANEHFDSSLVYSQKAVPHLLSIKDSLNLSYTYNNIAQSYKRLKKCDSALAYYKKADAITISGNIKKSKLLFYENMADLFELCEDLTQALTYLKKRDSIVEVVNDSAQNRALIDAERKYKTSEKEKELLISEKRQEQNKTIAVALAGLLAFGSIIFYLLHKNTKRKQRIAEQEREIEIQKTEKVLKEQELNTIDAMIAGQEKERKKLAEDLHDSVGATLAAAKLQFNHLSQHRDKLDTMDELFTKTGSLLDDAYSEIRSMAHLKNSGVIAKNGLLPALEKLAKNASSTNGLQVTVENFGLEKRLDSAHEITIFRIIQELVTNIIKHAEATEANISLTPHEEELSIIIEDNGKGFNPRAIIDQEGMGLANIERRVEHIEGTIEVDSTPGKGTTILIDIPL